MSPTDVEEAIVWVVMNTDSAPKSAKDDSLEADTEHLNRIYSKKEFIFLLWGCWASSNSTITAVGARIVDHDANSEKPNHEAYAPTAMDLSAVAPGLSGPKWRRTKARSAP